MPNTTIRAVREAMRRSQEEFARLVREAGDELSEPNDCTTRTVQRWENGSVSYPRRNYVRAIEKVTGYPIDELGFDLVPSVGKLSDHLGIRSEPPPTRLAADARASEPARLTPIMPTLTGIWESRCTYESSSRGETFVDRAHLVLIHAGDEITARSIDGSVTDGGSILMRLTQKGRVITGTWEQTTGPDSYYRGQQFHGAVQFQLEAAGAYMGGQWVGFGREFDINTGPWTLVRREAGTGRTAEYARPPEG